MDKKKIGSFIAQCRREKNLTQEQLAERLQVTEKSVSKLVFIGLLDGLTGAAAPLAPSQRELAKIFDF